MMGDDLVWKRSDQLFEDWERRSMLHKREVYEAIADLICQHRGGSGSAGTAIKLHRPIKGGYNVVYRLDFDEGPSAAMRIPCHGIVQFPEEKIRAEVATMGYIRENTRIPVPKVYHWGTAEENYSGLGPFIIMECVEHCGTMSEALNDPTKSPGSLHTLDPNVPEDKLMLAYSQIANILLQLSGLEFPKIGSLAVDDGYDDQSSVSVTVASRPLIHNMNALIEQGGVLLHVSHHRE